MDKQNWVVTSSGVSMPPIIYGTAWKKERTADLVIQAIKTGFCGIDTACQPKHYQEDLVGSALMSLDETGINREDLFLQTKFTPLSGQDPQQLPYDRHASIAEQVAHSFEVSQHHLNTTYIDSLVLHSPVFPYSLLIEGWRAMEAIHQAGHALQLGISNCYDLKLMQTLYHDAHVKPAVLQNRFYHDTHYDIELRQWCLDHNIIYQSFWTLTANPHLLASHAIQELIDRYHKTAAQILFRYLNQSGVVPLTGTCSQQHMQEALNMFDFELLPEEIKRIDDLLKS